MPRSRPSPRRLRVLLALLALASLALALQLGRRAWLKARYDNLVVVVVDTLRSDHLSSYGYERDTAPFLAELAGEGIQLQGLSTSSWTRPSIASMMSGLYPQRHQVNSSHDALPESVPYLAEILAGRGYRTVGFNTNAMLSPRAGFGRGYETYLQPVVNRKPDAALVTDRVLGLVPLLREPFYLYVHYMDPHAPYEPPRPWGRELPREAYRQPTEFADGDDVAPEVVELLVDQYDGEIRDVDRQLRRLFDGLRQAGLLDDTLLVVTSDHGEEFYERGLLNHGRTLQRESVHVPMIFWKAKGLNRYLSEDDFHQIDFLPTILEAVGVSHLPEGDGISRWGAILDPGSDPGDERTLLHYLDDEHYSEMALLSGPHKLIHSLRRRPTTRLYDLAEDPLERVSLDGDDVTRAALLEELVALHNRLGSRAAAQQRGELTEDELAGLRALGYLNAAGPSVPSASDRIPPRIRLYDTRVDGLFAGLPPSSLTSEVALDSASPQKLDGWDRKEPGLSGPRATLVLPTPGKDESLVLEGTYAGDPATLTVRAGEELPCTLRLDPGPFRLFCPFRSPTEDPVYIDLVVDARGTPIPGLRWKKVGWTKQAARADG